MALSRTPGSWLGFLQQGSTSANDETEPPSQPFDTANVDDQNPPPPSVDVMNLEELLAAPGRSSLPKLDPTRENGAGWFEYTKGITRTVKKIMENDYPQAAPNWTSLPGDTKLRWFKAFGQKFNWDFCHTTHIREEFDALCASRLLDRVYDWKVSWRNGENKPSWMKDTVWAGLILYWIAAKNVKRSITNSAKRNSPRGGYGISKHTCGSGPYVCMRENMRDEVTGELPDMVSFMEKTHKCKRDGVFVDKKAEEIARKCRQLEESKLSQMSNAQETWGESEAYELTHSEKNEIYLSEDSTMVADSGMARWILKIQGLHFKEVNLYTSRVCTPTRKPNSLKQPAR